MQSKVFQFNKDVLGIPQRKLGLMGHNEFNLSLLQLREEIQEMEDAFHEDNLVGMIDGMIDLHYFLMGVVYKHGVTRELYEKCFSAVHDANMEKKLGVKSGREGFGDAADAVKPEDWVPPEQRIQALLENHLYDPTLYAIVEEGDGSFDYIMNYEHLPECGTDWTTWPVGSPRWRELHQHLLALD